MNARFTRYVESKEYREHDGKCCSGMYLPLPLGFDDPEVLHDRIVRDNAHLESDWYETAPHYKAIATYACETDADGEVFENANPSDTDEFVVVDVSDPACPVHLWTHDTPFRNMDRLAPSLDAFLASLVSRT